MKTKKLFALATLLTGTALSAPALAADSVGKSAGDLMVRGRVIVVQADESSTIDPIGGHAGKQHGLALHLGLGKEEQLDKLVITWPDRSRTTQLFGALGPGRYEKVFTGE